MAGAARQQPFFLFLHYFDPHFPYDPPPPFPSTYAGEIAYVDASIGKVFDKLRELGLYDDTLVILTGDHGEGLGARRGATRLLDLSEHAPCSPDCEGPEGGSGNAS